MKADPKPGAFPSQTGWEAQNRQAGKPNNSEDLALHL